MKFVVLLMSEGENPPWDEQTPEQQAAAMQRHEDFGAACRARDRGEHPGWGRLRRDAHRGADPRWRAERDRRPVRRGGRAIGRLLPRGDAGPPDAAGADRVAAGLRPPRSARSARRPEHESLPGPDRVRAVGLEHRLRGRAGGLLPRRRPVTCCRHGSRRNMRQPRRPRTPGGTGSSGTTTNCCRSRRQLRPGWPAPWRWPRRAAPRPASLP